MIVKAVMAALMIAQLGQHVDSTASARRVDGRVLRGTRKGQDPVANQTVVLHRVGTDRAAPLDSTRTDGRGNFSIHYKASGDSAAIYFVSTMYGGVAYFTAPLREPVVRGDDATLIVFDTTSSPVPIAIAGRHVIVGTPDANGRRSVGEVYDLKNDSTVTRIASDNTRPVWSAHIPAAASNFQLNQSGEIAPGAVAQRGSTVQLFAPISPGMRQFAFTYDLPSSAFPLSIPAEDNEGVVEVLVQEPRARVHTTGAVLKEMAPVSPDGRVFRRFLAQDVPAGSVLEIDTPTTVGAAREQVYVGVGVTVAVAMGVALIVAARRKTPRFAHATSTARATSPSERLLRSLAALDDQFARNPRPSDAERAGYEASRAALKAQLAASLAAERERAEGTPRPVANVN